MRLRNYLKVKLRQLFVPKTDEINRFVDEAIEFVRLNEKCGYWEQWGDGKHFFFDFNGHSIHASATQFTIDHVPVLGLLSMRRVRRLIDALKDKHYRNRIYAERCGEINHLKKELNRAVS